MNINFVGRFNDLVEHQQQKQRHHNKVVEEIGPTNSGRDV